MLQTEQEIDKEEQKLELLRKWLSGISGEKRAYIKGATEALIHAQEISRDGFEKTNAEETPCRQWTREASKP